LGLNPHAGDGGLIGTEEEEIIKGVVAEQRNKNKLVFGPFPADGFFGSSHYTRYDAVLAMYHDQGLIPFKAIAFENGVNYTAGLSIVRTSPDHGTAYNIAGKNEASEQSTREALFQAIAIFKSRGEQSTEN
jgi:4-hydroxy-L-threonine phosphate dehydrogenase PdxA